MKFLSHPDRSEGISYSIQFEKIRELVSDVSTSLDMTEIRG